ncbi:MAG: VirB3 family type IV secretion system protein [Fusobacterium gastrosuis]|uniref:VirB3 family type IV secretion system protein n=1 Tax=Fusobacterium gastrosuis TaxID=1755100 RepID=UPI002976A856|nr:VirB3 family type IV secretion system protein [Fusobacteriaceae bacterium]MDY4010991.1 VirB3 family type IV secretion system protein [Fusobacterium gastrosuis]MDY5713557.1 VirB3 family type IV secretion system protein [Fusobacterium gastrosuis]
MKYEDLRTPICRGFLALPTVGGGERTAVLLNLLLGLMLFFATSTLYFMLLVTLPFHYAIVALTKKDYLFFTVFRNHLKYKEYYNS